MDAGLKKSKIKQIHTPQVKTGMGDYYGSGVRNPMGKLVDSYAIGSIKKPAKSSSA